MQDQVFSSLHALRGGYGFLTDYRSYPQAQARGRVATLAQTFGIKEFQFYDWFATYSKPTTGSSSFDPFKHERQIYLETILTYIDEIHRHGGRAWAYVQAVGADEDDLADRSARIFQLRSHRTNGTPNRIHASMVKSRLPCTIGQAKAVIWSLSRFQCPNDSADSVAKV